MGEPAEASMDRGKEAIRAGTAGAGQAATSTPSETILAGQFAKGLGCEPLLVHCLYYYYHCHQGQSPLMNFFMLINIYVHNQVTILECSNIVR